MPSVLPAGECIRRKSGCSLRTCRRRTVPWSLPLGKGRYPRCPAVGERSLSPMPCRWGEVVVPDALPLGRGRCPRCPAVVERSLSPMPLVLPAGERIRRKSGCSLRTCRRRTVSAKLPVSITSAFVNILAEIYAHVLQLPGGIAVLKIASGSPISPPGRHCIVLVQPALL